MTTITGIITSIQNILNLLVPLVLAVAFIVFIYGIFKYFIMGGANEESRDSGKQLAVWGIVAFAIMVSVWGLVNIITGTLNFKSTTRPCVPTFSGSTACPSTTSNDIFTPSELQDLQNGAAKENSQSSPAPTEPQQESGTGLPGIY